MAYRYYITELEMVDGVIRSALATHTPYVDMYADGRVDGNTPGDICLVGAEITDAAHALAQADPRVRYIPLEASNGAVVAATQPVGDVSAANRTAIRTRLEAHHVPLHDLALDSTVSKVLARIAWRLRVRAVELRDLDWWEGLDTTLSTIPAARRQAIADRLAEVGYDTSVLLATDTIREAMRKLSLQRKPLGNW